MKGREGRRGNCFDHSRYPCIKQKEIPLFIRMNTFNNEVFSNELKFLELSSRLRNMQRRRDRSLFSSSRMQASEERSEPAMSARNSSH